MREGYRNEFRGGCSLFIDKTTPPIVNKPTKVYPYTPGQADKSPSMITAKASLDFRVGRSAKPEQGNFMHFKAVGSNGFRSLRLRHRIIHHAGAAEKPMWRVQRPSEWGNTFYFVYSLPFFETYF